MSIVKKDELELRKIGLAYLISSPFISGYLFCVKFEFAGFVVTLFRLGLLMCFCLGVWLLLTCKTNLHRISGKVSVSLVSWFVIILFIGVGHAVLKGVLPGGISEMVAIAENLLFFLCLLLLIQGDRLLWIFSVNVFKYTGVVVSILSYFEMFFGFKMPSSRFNEVEYYEGVSFHPATSIFTNENNLSAFLLIVSTILIWQMLYEENKKKYCVQCAQLIIVICPAIVADSTIFRLGIILITIIACVFFSINNAVGKRKVCKCGIQIAIPFMFCYVLKKFVRAVCIIISLKVFNQDSQVSDIVLKRLIKGDGIMEQLQNSGMGTVTMRKNLLIYGIDAGRESPFWGNGANSFLNIFKQNTFYLEKTGGMVNPHNFLIEIFVQYGGISAILLLLICIVACYIAGKGAFSLKFKNDERYDRGLILIMLISFAITTVMPSGFFKCIVYFIPLFFAVIGIDCNRDREGCNS